MDKFIGKVSTALMIVALLSLLTACGAGRYNAQAVNPGSGGAGGFVELKACGACKLTEADQQYGVPANFGLQETQTLSSSNGGYYHKAGNCDCFVADIWMYFNSNQTPYPNGDPGEVRVTANAFDLPSSVDNEKIRPGIEEDCNRYYRAIRMWEKREGTDTWEEIRKQEVIGGDWNGFSCGVTSAGYEEISPSTTNVARTLRVAVKVLLRDSAQKAQVKAFLPGPD